MVEKEYDGQLTFLDTLLSADDDGSITSMYHKDSHTDQYAAGLTTVCSFTYILLLVKQQTLIIVSTVIVTILSGGSFISLIYMRRMG